MKLKINRYEFDVSNKDIILDNGACYQCLTLKHYTYSASGSFSWVTTKVTTTMSKAQFQKLLKNNQVVLIKPEQAPKLYKRYNGCKLWRFNIENTKEHL